VNIRSSLFSETTSLTCPVKLPSSVSAICPCIRDTDKALLLRMACSCMLHWDTLNPFIVVQRGGRRVDRTISTTIPDLRRLLGASGLSRLESQSDQLPRQDAESELHC
jgi:hypothetical protein